MVDYEPAEPRIIQMLTYEFLQNFGIDPQGLVEGDWINIAGRNWEYLDFDLHRQCAWVRKLDDSKGRTES